MISLHVDGTTTREAAGVATYYYGNDRYGHHSAVGERFADLVQREICARTDLLDCRVHAKTWDLLRRTRMPAVRIELGYLTNPGDAARLADPAFRDTLAEAIVRRGAAALPAAGRRRRHRRRCASRSCVLAASRPSRVPRSRAGSHRAERRLRVHRAEQPLQRDLDVLAPGQRVAQVQPQPREAVVRPHRLEADRQQEVGRHDARLPTARSRPSVGGSARPNASIARTPRRVRSLAAPWTSIRPSPPPVNSGSTRAGHQQHRVAGDRRGREGHGCAARRPAGRRAGSRPAIEST